MKKYHFYLKSCIRDHPQADNREKFNTSAETIPTSVSSLYTVCTRENSDVGIFRWSSLITHQSYTRRLSLTVFFL